MFDNGQDRRGVGEPVVVESAKPVVASKCGLQIERHRLAVLPIHKCHLALEAHGEHTANVVVRQKMLRRAYEPYETVLAKAAV